MNNRPDQKNTPFVEAFVYRYLPYWPLFAVLAVIFTALSVGYLRYATPVYEANATILIKDEKKGAEESSLSESMNVLSSKKIVENEVVVLQSRNLADKIVAGLRLYAPISESGRLGNRTAYTSSPIVVTAFNLDQVQTTQDIPFTYDAAARKVLVGGAAYPLDQLVATPYGSLTFSPNPRYKPGSNGPFHFRLVDPKSVAAGLQKKLDVAPAGKLSSIVRLKYSDESPERAEDILNNLVRDYNAASIDYKNSVARNTIAFVDERMRIVQRELNAVEKQIQSFKARNNVVDLSEQGKLYLKNVGEIDQKLAEVNMKMAVLGQVEQYVSAKQRDGSLVPSTLGIEDPLLSGLLEKLYQADLERDRLSRTTAENHPVMLALDEQIEKLRPGILDNIRSQRSALSASQRNLASTNSAYNSMLNTIPQKERELLDVSREQSIKNSIYSFLLQKREETAIAVASNIPDSKVVETARASVLPVGPNKPFILGAGIAFALLLSIAYVAWKEGFSRNVLFRDEIGTYTGVPVLAEIAHVDHLKGKLLSAQKDARVGEEFRQLRVAAGLFSKSNPKKRLLVTSSVAGEGKSFVASNLAVNLSLSGKKVVLLDMDLRNPQASRNFGAPQAMGLAEYLENEVEPYEIIKSTEYKNLYLVSAGTTESNATELLLNGKLAPLFDYLEEAFDFIIMDAAPVHPATDAYFLTEWSDLTLYVVRHAYTPKAFVQNLDANNRIKALNNLAIVFNDVKPRGFGSGSYGYGYGHEMRYGQDAAGDSRLKKFLRQLSFQKKGLKKA
ncbi:polysaccharide biosynthesis tyrosine autokinase [Flaviaesturariibacter amylovorans]|uniref:Tyrosine-protein kinase n=1 Tax=Flaviaesturariibacter amylovorans TaxID=1084520 RepID=A0ABP8GRS0_9BACT